MRPAVNVVFMKMAQDLMERVIPAISPTYHQGTIGMIATMLLSVAEEWDRVASRRVEENRSIRDLFRKASSIVNKPDLAKRLRELSETKDDDFHISALENNNCTLRAALIDLHAHIESQQGKDARTIEDAIWKELAASTERRRFSTASF